MIDQEIIKQYPSLVARPYLLIKDDIQRKDMQRFWFENTISFLSVLSAAELVRYYKDLKSKEEKTDKDLDTIKLIQEHKSLTMVGLEHMALGKWVMMLRETTKLLHELGAASIVPELVEFYHGKNGKNNAKTIDKLVSIRNDDAHGNPIPEDKLNAELDKRQKLIDSLLEQLDFLKDYQLILPEKLEIEGSKQFYICKRFVGASIINTKETFDFSPQLSEVMLINSSNKDEKLSLSPLLLYLGIQDEENSFIGVFSKYTSKDATEAKYLNLDGSATIDLINFGQDQDVDLIVQRQSYNEIYADPESFHVNLEISMKLEESLLDINTTSSLSLLVENKKSTDIEELKIILDIPKHIQIIELPENGSYTVSQQDQQLSINFNNFEDSETAMINDIKFTVSEQGSYTFDNGQALYSYYRTLADQESNQVTEEEIQYEGESVEVRDPNSRDKMIPVVNISKGFTNIDGDVIQNVKIGEDFIFRINVSNIGFSAAKDVLIDLVFPEDVNLKQGKETIKIGQLNPFEERTFKYVLNSHTPNIYTISMQNVLYSDSQRIRYSTRCSDDHFIVVRSDLIKEFVYDVKGHIDDLYIDDEEKANIHEMVEKLDESIDDVNGYDIYKEAETESVIKIIRDLINKVALKKDIKVIEKVYEEGKRDAKITGVEPRKFLLFSSKEMPFFAINLTKGYEPEFFALRTNIDKRFDHVKISQAVVASGSYTLDHCIDFSDIKYNESYGKDFFSQWLNIIFSKFDKEYILWNSLIKRFGNIYGEPMSYVSGYYSKHYWEKPSNESGVTSNYTLMDRENPQTYYIAFEANSTPSYRQIIGNYIKQNRELDFLSATSKQTRKRIYDDKQLSYYLQLSDTGRASRYIALKQKIKDDSSLDETMEKTKELWEHLCLAHSLDLLDDDEFKNQKFLDEMKQFIYDLFEKGFALRKNIKHKDILDIYPLKYFQPHTASERDCIGFIKKYHSSWQIFLDFFEDEIPDSIVNELSYINSNIIADKVRWIKSDIKSVEQLQLITQTILTQATQYKPSKLAIWPKRLQREMILNHGQTDSGFFIILKNILSGENNYNVILEELKSMGLEKELDRTLNRSAQFVIDAGYESPLNVEGEDENKIIIVNESLEETIKLLYEEKPSFEYLEEGSALFRIQAKKISLKYEFLACRAPYNSGMVDNSYKAQNKYFKVCWFIINPIKGQKIEFFLTFLDCKPEVDEIIKNTYVELNNKLNNELVFGRSGRKNQHIKVLYTHTFNDFEAELEHMQNLCFDFFTEAENGIEKLSNEK